ncbi:MAG: UDP-N-acetylmuramate dehydrogenase [Erysipelothrix sp.]|nr:UDP-N-acetylmuramate dehydrogenase [Erysipelothrix sp.]
MLKELEAYGLLAYNRSFKEMTTIKVGGAIKYYFEPNNMYGLTKAIEIIESKQLAYKIIGNGSNLLCSNKDFDGVVIKLNNLNHFEVNDNIMYVEAGVPIIVAANYAINNGLSGLEFATGIPALMGGIIYMNASAYNEAISDVIESVLVYQAGSLKWIDKADLYFGYRESSFQTNKDWLIMAVNLKLEHADSETLKALAIDRNQRRFRTQPFEYPNCGSVFRNLSDKPVWKIIDEANLRGLQIGQAQISEKHSNFICNLGQASADDVNALIEKTISLAKENDNIDLFLEVERFNW